MRVGLWGSYDKGNFGDDLMAIIFCKYLQQCGHSVTVYNPSEALKEQLACESTHSIRGFVSTNDVIVIGGGGMLINNSLPRFLLKRTAFEFEKSFYDLYTLVRKYQKKIIPISIGGASAGYMNNPYKKKLFSSSYTHAATVRLPSDLHFLDHTVFKYIPDVVLATPHFYKKPREVPAGQKKKLVLNLKKKTAGALMDVLQKSGVFDTYEVVTFSSHAHYLAELGGYEYTLDGANFQFDRIAEAVDLLMNADVVISSKLHVGVTALSYGNVFISYKGPAKAKEFLKTENLEHYIMDDEQQIAQKLAVIHERHERIEDNHRLQNSFEHLTYLKESLESYPTS